MWLEERVWDVKEHSEGTLGLAQRSPWLLVLMVWRKVII